MTFRPDGERTFPRRSPSFFPASKWSSGSVRVLSGRQSLQILLRASVLLTGESSIPPGNIDFSEIHGQIYFSILHLFAFTGIGKSIERKKLGTQKKEWRKERIFQTAWKSLKGMLRKDKRGIRLLEKKRIGQLQSQKQTWTRKLMNFLPRKEERI